MAVEDQLVLAADHVAERDVRGVVSRARAKHLLAGTVLAEVERRRRHVDEQLCTGEREVRRRRSRLPHVLADGHADERVAVDEDEELVAGREVAELVEDAVVRQEALLHERLHLPVRADGAHVVEVAVEDRRADEGDDAARLARDLVQRLLGRAHEARPQQQVLRRIARHRELGKDGEIGARVPGLLEAVEDQGAVAVEVADDGVDLGECESHWFQSISRKPRRARSRPGTPGSRARRGHPDPCSARARESPAAQSSPSASSGARRPRRCGRA